MENINDNNDGFISKEVEGINNSLEPVIQMMNNRFPHLKPHTNIKMKKGVGNEVEISLESLKFEKECHGL